MSALKHRMASSTTQLSIQHASEVDFKDQLTLNNLKISLITRLFPFGWLIDWKIDGKLGEVCFILDERLGLCQTSSREASLLLLCTFVLKVILNHVANFFLIGY